MREYFPDLVNYNRFLELKKYAVFYLFLFLQHNKDLFGRAFGGKGYVGKEYAEKLKEIGVKSITSVRKNMKKPLIDAGEVYLLGKRGIIETVIDQLKNVCQIEHT